MTPIKRNAIAALFFVLCLLGSFSVFTVAEGQSAFILRLGKIVTDSSGAPITERPGLHFCIPLIDDVRYFDMRIQTLATPSSHPLTVVTKEQTYLQVDYFAKWRITNLSTFYTSTGGSIRWAENLLEQRINDIVRAEFGRRTGIQAISTERTPMVNSIRDLARKVGKDQGITISDIRIQQITLPKDVMDSVFKRMATERKQFAEAKRASGLERSEEIKALADKEVTVIKAKALAEAANIRAKGSQAAATIYAKAYSKDPNFYSFYRSLEAYRNSFNNKNDVFVLKPEGQFFSFFRGNSTQNKSN